MEYISRGFEKKYRGIYGILLWAAGCLLYFGTVTILNQVSQFEGILGLGYGAVLYLYGRIALSGRRTEMAVVSIIWVMITMISAYIMFGVLGLMTGDGLGTLLASEGDGRIYSALAAAVLKFSFGRMVLALYRNKLSTPARIEDFMVGWTYLIMLLLMLGMFHLETGRLNQTERHYLSLFLLGGLAGLIALVSGFHWRMDKYRREKLEAEHEKAKREIQEKQIHDLYRIGREANHMRHDMKAKLDVVSLLLKKGEYQAAEECIGRLGGEWGNYQELPQDTGNEGLNAALLRAIQECRERGIKFHYVILGKIVGIDTMDMGNLVYNLLINGIEASEKADGEKEVEIYVKNIGEGTEIETGNTIRESVINGNPHLKSRKSETLRHGFGLESIRGIVEKYHGEYTYWEEDNWFMQKIVLSDSLIS